MSDHYATLGLDRSASTEDIKKAYRKMAHKYHPDKGAGDEEKFKEVNEAYQVLSDDQKKSQYDQFGQTFSAGGGPAPGGEGYGGFGFGGEEVDLSDIFGQFFGGARGGAGTRVNRGADVQMDDTITLKESAFGLKKEINVRLNQACEKCHGNGAEPGTPIETCTTCNGQGVISKARQTPLGTFAQQVACTDCHGEGKSTKTKCTQCRGEGREVRDQSLEIEIPAGIADGQTIRLSGKGEAAPRGGVAGDMYLTIHVGSQDGITRDGNVARTSITIPFTEAALGTSKTIGTLDGDENLDIPAGTQPNTEVPIFGKGFPDHLGSSNRDDHIVTVNVEIPKKLSREQQQLLEQFDSAKKKGFFN